MTRRHKFLALWLIILVGLLGLRADAQNLGAPLMWLPMQFDNAAGVLLPGGKLCTYLAGTTTPVNTYLDKALTTQNVNPLVLGSDGEPQVPVFLDGVSYKFVLRTPGADATCSTGSVIRTWDDKYDLASFFRSTFATKLDDKICHPSMYTGANASAKLAACEAVGPSTGIIVEMSGLDGAQAWNANPFSGISKPVFVQMAAGTTTVSANVTVPSNVTLMFREGSVLSVNGGSTLTVNGGVWAPATQIFTGGGTVTFGDGAELLNGVNPRWFGAAGDGVAVDTTAFQKAINSISKGLIRVTRGTYLLANVAMHDSLYFSCDPGWYTTTIKGDGAVTMFAYDTSVSNVSSNSFEGCTFAGTGASAVRASNVGAGSGYLAAFWFVRNFFSAELSEGTYGNMILSHWVGNEFGTNGSPQASGSRHVYSKGNAALAEASNMNWLSSNRFYHATAQESVYFESGYHVDFEDNNFEQNDSTGANPVALRILGMYHVILNSNWFEQNLGTYNVWMGDDFTTLNGNAVVWAWNNWFDLSRVGNLAVFNLNGATTQVDIRYNTGVMSVLQYLTCYAAANCDDLGIENAQYNHMIGGYLPVERAQFNGKVGVNTIPVLSLHIKTANNDGFRTESSVTSKITTQTLTVTDGAAGSQGRFLVYDNTPTIKVQLDANASGGLGFLSPYVWANLPAVGNGSFLICSDCTVATNPCTNGGTGTIALRIGGAWVCR